MDDPVIALENNLVSLYTYSIFVAPAAHEEGGGVGGV